MCLWQAAGSSDNGSQDGSSNCSVMVETAEEPEGESSFTIFMQVCCSWYQMISRFLKMIVLNHFMQVRCYIMISFLLMICIQKKGL